MNWLRRIGLIVVSLSLVVVIGAAAAMAAEVPAVAEDLAELGFYLDSGVSISEGDATEIVSAARNDGSRLHLVVLHDTPLGGNTVFAEAVLDDLAIPSGTVVVLSPDDIGWVTEGDGFSEDDMGTALEFADSEGGNDAEYAANFVIGLVGTPLPSDGVSGAAEPSGGGGSGLIWFALIIGGIGFMVFWLIRRGKKETVNAAAERMAKVRTAVQKQVDAVANDILDMEDEIRVTDNREADQLYNEAGETYRRVTEQLPEAKTPQQLLDLSNDLDVAIWLLDSAEALLDGNQKPPRPEPKRLEPIDHPLSERVTAPAPRPDYQRRPSRRSSYLGPGMLEMLIGVAGQVTGGGRGRRRGTGSMRRRSSTSTSPRRARRGGGIGSGSPMRQRTTRRSTPRATTRHRGGGRIRGGGRRRK